RWALLALAVVAAALLAWRGFGLSRYSTSPAAVERDVVPLAPVDLNHAGEAELASIPGVGETLAARIVLHRHVHGEFRSVDDLRRVRGVGDKTRGCARPSVQVVPSTERQQQQQASATPAPKKGTAAGMTKKPPPPTKIDVNRAGVAELQKLPGIGPTLAARI